MGDKTMKQPSKSELAQLKQITVSLLGPGELEEIATEVIRDEMRRVIAEATIDNLNRNNFRAMVLDRMCVVVGANKAETKNVARKRARQ